MVSLEKKIKSNQIKNFLINFLIKKKKKRKNKDKVSILLVWCHPNVRETLVCFKTAKLTLRFQPEKIQCGLLDRLVAFSSCTGGYAGSFFHFFILEKKPNNTPLMGCFETYWTTVSSGHLDDTMQAAWRHATFFIRPRFLCVF